jgi:hypothetical protein
MRFAVVAVLAVLAAVPASAQADPQLQAKLARESVRYGSAHQVKGTLRDGTTPLQGQQVVLEGRRYPYEGSYRVIDRATTDEQGEFSFKPKLDRNHRLRVTGVAQLVSSGVLHAYVAPAFTLSFRAVTPGVVRLYQRYTVPKRVKLKAPTQFYLGSRKAKQASLRRDGKLKRTRAGHYSSQVTVQLPAGWNGSFRYASCFRASPHSGMGDPGQSCPKLHLRF